MSIKTTGRSSDPAVSSKIVNMVMMVTRLIPFPLMATALPRLAASMFLLVSTVPFGQRPLVT